MNDFKTEFQRLDLLTNTDILAEAANVYEKLLNKDFIYKLEDGQIIKTYFLRENFHHLVGLQYLLDIPQVTKDLAARPRRTANSIYRNIKNRNITYSDIEKSNYIDDMYDRLNHFQDVDDVIYWR